MDHVEAQIHPVVAPVKDRQLLVSVAGAWHNDCFIEILLKTDLPTHHSQGEIYA